MIILPSGKGFQYALSKVYFPQTDQSERSAHSHIKVEQIDTELTAVTAFGEGGAWFERYCQGSGVTGTRFLFRPRRIEDDMNAITLLKKQEYSGSPVAVYQDEAELAFVSVEEMKDGLEIKREGARNHFPLYAVDETEDQGFGPPVFAETRLATCEAKAFDNAVRDSHNFGGDKYNAFAVVYFVLSPNKLQVLSSNYRRETMLCRSCNANTESETVIAFNAAYLQFLSDLGEEGSALVIKQDDEEAVTFQGTNGRVTLPVYQEEGIYKLVDQKLMILDEERRHEVAEVAGTPLQFIGRRVARLKESHQRVEVQQSQDTQLKLESRGTNLVVTKLKDTKRKRPDASQLPVATDYSDCLETEWVPLVVNFTYFLKALSIAITFINRQDDLQTDAYSLDLYCICLPSGKPQYILLLEPVSSPPAERYQLFYQPIPAEDVDDQANND